MDARHTLAEKNARVTQLESDANAKAEDIQKARNDVINAQQAQQQAELRLNDARQSLYDKANKQLNSYADQMGDIGAKLDNFGISRACRDRGEPVQVPGEPRGGPDRGDAGCDRRKANPNEGSGRGDAGRRARSGQQYTPDAIAAAGLSGGADQASSAPGWCVLGGDAAPGATSRRASWPLERRDSSLAGRRLFQCRRGSRQPVGRAADHGGRGHGRLGTEAAAGSRGHLSGMGGPTDGEAVGFAPPPQGHRASRRLGRWLGQRFASPRWRGWHRVPMIRRSRRTTDAPSAAESPGRQHVVASLGSGGRLWRVTAPTGHAPSPPSLKHVHPRLPGPDHPAASAVVTHRPTSSAVSAAGPVPGAHRSSLTNPPARGASPRRWRRNRAGFGPASDPRTGNGPLGIGQQPPSVGGPGSSSVADLSEWPKGPGDGCRHVRPGSGAAVQMASQIINKTIQFGGRPPGWRLGDRRLLLDRRQPARLTGQFVARRMAGGIAGAKPALPNLAGKKPPDAMTGDQASKPAAGGGQGGNTFNTTVNNNRATEDGTGRDLNRHLEAMTAAPGRQ